MKLNGNNMIVDNDKLSAVSSGIVNAVRRGNVRRDNTILLVLFFFLIASCTFESDELFVNPTIQDKKPPEVYSASLDLEADTIYIYTDKQIEFKFVSSDQEIRLLIWYLNGQKLQSVQSDEGVFYLNYGALSAGFHELSIELYTMTGSGSIAEAAGIEGFMFEKQWILYVIRYDGTPVNYGVEDGRLRLDWSPYPANNLKEYRITHSYSYLEKINVGASNINYFIDSIYVGQSGTFLIHAITTDNEILFWGGCTIPSHAPPLLFNSNEQNEYWLSWSDCLYYNNIDSLRLYRRKRNESNYQLIYETEYIPEFIYNIDSARFGERIEYRLVIIAHPHYLPDIKYPTMYMYNDIRAGYKFYNKKISGTIKAIGNDQIIFSESGLVKFCLNDLQVKEKLVYESSWGTNASFNDFTVSPQGSFYTANLSSYQKLVIYGPTGYLSSSKTVDLQLFPGALKRAIPVSDIGTGMIRVVNSGFYLYDFINLQIIGHYTQLMSRAVCISTCGEYMIIFDAGYKLITFSDNSFQQLMVMPHSPKIHFEFSSVIPEQFIHWDGSTVRIINASEQSIIASYPLTDKIFSVDFYNEQILTSIDDNLLVRSLYDGSILHSMSVSYAQLGPTDKYFLAYNLIISNNGVLYFLQNENQ